MKTMENANYYKDMSETVTNWLIAAFLLNKDTDSAISNASSPYKIHGKLHVSPRGIMDEKGELYQLKGMSTHGITWYPDYVNLNTFKYFKEDWLANVLRLAMYTDTGDDRGYCSGGDKEQIEKLIDIGVNAAEKIGLYVIIDWHILSDGNPNTYKEEAKLFFDKMSKKYASYGNVIYEIANEPNGETTWEDIKSYSDEIIPIIRANSPDSVIIVGTPTWCQDVDDVIENPVENNTNIIYAVHFYAGSHKENLRNKVKNAADAGVPIIISEFGLCDSSGDGEIDYDQSDKWFELIDNYKLSYICWSISNKAETCSLIDSSCVKINDFSDDDLTDSGKYLKEKMN